MNSKDDNIEEFKTWFAQAQHKNAPFCSHENEAKVLHLLQYQEIKIRDKCIPVPCQSLKELDVETVRAKCVETFPDYNHADGGKFYHYPLNVIAIFQGKSPYSVPRRPDTKRVTVETDITTKVGNSDFSASTFSVSVKIGSFRTPSVQASSLEEARKYRSLCHKIKAADSPLGKGDPEVLAEARQAAATLALKQDRFNHHLGIRSILKSDALGTTPGVVKATRIFDPPVTSRHFAELGAGTQFAESSTAIVPAPEKRTLSDTDDDDFSEDDAWGRRELLQIAYKKPKVEEPRDEEEETVYDDSDREMATDSEFAALEEELPEPCIETSDKFIEREFSKIAKITPKQLDYMDDILNKQKQAEYDKGNIFWNVKPILLRRVAPIINDPDNNRQMSTSQTYHWIDKTFANMSDAEFKGGYFGLEVYYERNPNPNSKKRYRPIMPAGVRPYSIDHVLAQFFSPFDHPRFYCVLPSGGLNSTLNNKGIVWRTSTVIGISSSELRAINNDMKKIKAELRAYMPDIYAKLPKVRDTRLF